MSNPLEYPFKRYPLPWRILPLDGKYYGTEVASADGTTICVFWNHDSPRLTVRRISSRMEEELRSKECTDKEWEEFLDDYICDTHHETEEDYLTALGLVTLVNRG